LTRNRRPALDLDCDGQVTVVDVVGVAERAGTVIQTEDSGFWSLAETQSFHAMVAEGESEGFAGLSWACWARAAGLAVAIGILIGQMWLCSSACIPPTPVCAAGLNACYYAIVCTMAAVVFKLARCIAECVGDHQLSEGLEVFFELADALASLCGGGATTVGLYRVAEKLLKILRETQRHL